MRYLSIIASAALFFAVTFAAAASRFTENGDFFEQLRRVYPHPATADWEHQYAGEYFVENNVWNKGSTRDYRQEIGIRENQDSSVSVAWAWDWPESPVIVAFPDILYGKNPWAAESSTPKMPVAIKDLDTLTAEFGFTHYGYGHRNSSFQIWLTTDSADDRHLLNEIMIWIRNDNLPPAPFLKNDSIAGEPFTVTTLENHGDPNLKPAIHWNYYAFVNPRLDWKGRIDLLAFLKYLIKNKLIDPDAYVAVINFGNEIRDGKGITALDHYRIRLVRKSVAPSAAAPEHR